MKMPRSTNTMIFGEVLFDSFPDGNRVLGGAPFNVAWHCQAFGLKPLFISRIGNDKYGAEIISKMQDWGMRLDGLQTDDNHPTGIVEVKFNDGEPSYDIRQNAAWDFIDAHDIPEFKENTLLYHGSLALRNTNNQKVLDTIINNISPVIFVDINLRDPWWSKEIIEKILFRSAWAKLNEGELDTTTGTEITLIEKMKTLIQQKHLEMLIVTLGAEGAVVIDSEHNLYEGKPALNNKVIDTVGAGDAFSSVFLAGNYHGWSPRMTLSRALDFAEAIIGIQGATTDDREFYKPFIEKWQLNV